MLAAIRGRFNRAIELSLPGGWDPLFLADGPTSNPHQVRVETPIEISDARAGIWTMMRIGGIDEAVVRAALFVIGESPQADRMRQRAIETLARMLGRPSPLAIEPLVHNQQAVLELDCEVAIESLPALVPDDADSAARFSERIGEVVGDLARDDPQAAARLECVRAIVSFVTA